MKKHKAKKMDKEVDMEPKGKSLEGPQIIESADEDAKEPPSEHELDMHHKTLMDAEAVQGNPHLMKHLKPHMEKKMGHMEKIMSLAQLKAVAKKKAMED